MKKAGKRLFRKLGELRDAHVMQDWVHRLDTPGDPVTGALLQFVAANEPQKQQDALRALQEFDRKQWERWSRFLPRRTTKFQQGGPIFRHLALESWTNAYRLHRQAINGGSATAFHRLRIGVKRFRYIVENFLPDQHAAWSDDLKLLQDLLGEVHDLDVLWSLAARASVFPDAEARSRWQRRIHEERVQRIGAYEKRTAGKDSLWQIWRTDLPKGEQVKSAAHLRLKTWASLLDPDFKHSMHVARLALQLYNGLTETREVHKSDKRDGNDHDRAVLNIAALLHDVGRSKSGKNHHKNSYKMILSLSPPLGVRRLDIAAAATVARYHRGVLPAAGQEALRGLSSSERKNVTEMAAILRLANALDASRDGRIRRLEVRRQDGILQIFALGYSPRDQTAEAVAAARHLLETICKQPVMVKAISLTKRGTSSRTRLTAKERRKRSAKRFSELKKDIAGT